LNGRRYTRRRFTGCPERDIGAHRPALGNLTAGVLALSSGLTVQNLSICQIAYSRPPPRHMQGMSFSLGRRHRPMRPIETSSPLLISKLPRKISAEPIGLTTPKDTSDGQSSDCSMNVMELFSTRSRLHDNGPTGGDIVVPARRVHSRGTCRRPRPPSVSGSSVFVDQPLGANNPTPTKNR